MERQAPSKAIKDLDAQVRRILRPVDLLKQDRTVRESVATLGQHLHDARIYAVDYELSETREEQVDNAKQARKYLKAASHAVLTASQHDIFSAIDVAHIIAVIEQVRADLR